VVVRGAVRDERAVARLLLLRAAAARLGVAPSEVWVEYEPAGRPRLGGAGAGLHVSLSHGRGVVAVALTTVGPVGVDVEALRSLPTVGLARRFFAVEEADWVRECPAGERDAAFLGLWTCKEAMGKALGTGLRAGGMRRGVPVALRRPVDGAGPAVLRPLADATGLHVAGMVLPRHDAVLAVAASGAAAGGARVEVVAG
jgi:4'-phosphopantetheinyl transferase